jgi:hypothetical protein
VVWALSFLCLLPSFSTCGHLLFFLLKHCILGSTRRVFRRWPHCHFLVGGVVGKGGALWARPRLGHLGVPGLEYEGVGFRAPGGWVFRGPRQGAETEQGVLHLQNLWGEPRGCVEV